MFKTDINSIFTKSDVDSFVQSPTVLIVYLESVWSYRSYLSGHDNMVFLGNMAADSP